MGDLPKLAWSRDVTGKVDNIHSNLFPRTKDTDASVLKKKGLQKFFSGEKVFKNSFSGDLYLRKPKKRSLQIFRKVSGVFQRNFNGSKKVLSSSREQGNFRGLEASRPRPRTSKCVLEAKDVLKDSLSTKHLWCLVLIRPIFAPKMKTPLPQRDWGAEVVKDLLLFGPQKRSFLFSGAHTKLVRRSD